MAYIRQAGNIQGGEIMVYYTGELGRARDIEANENFRKRSVEAPVGQLADYFWSLHEAGSGHLMRRRAPSGVTGFEYLYIGARI